MISKGLLQPLFTMVSIIALFYYSDVGDAEIAFAKSKSMGLDPLVDCF